MYREHHVRLGRLTLTVGWIPDVPGPRFDLRGALRPWAWADLRVGPVIVGAMID